MTLPRQVAVLFRFQLRDEVRTGEVASVVIPFGAIALLVIPMAIGIETTLLARVGPGLFWAIVLLFGVVVTQRRTAMAQPAHRDALTLLGVDPAARFAATALASGVLLLVFEVAVGIVTIVLYDPPITGWSWLALALPLVAAGLAMLGTIAGSVAAGRGPLAPLLVAPLAIPLLLGASQTTEGLIQGAGILRWILLLALVDVLLALAGVLTARPLEGTST
ncbi:MAG TPA: heme exporter protein CcmB [Acidimicrobiia bacterium]|nr:heme exporter protein CcmB [Acidimicrobiia bacterium]